jgi:hypothetical protein
VTYVVRTKDLVDHEVADVTDSGNYVTKCENMFMKDQIVNVFEDTVVNCKGCAAPPVHVPRPAKPRPAGSKPAYRPSRDLVLETQQGAKFAHIEVVAGLEWLQRGEPGQFLDTALDRLHLAYRFLHEVLVNHDRIDDVLDDAE